MERENKKCVELSFIIFVNLNFFFLFLVLGLR